MLRFFLDVPWDLRVRLLEPVISPMIFALREISCAALTVIGIFYYENEDP